MSTLYIHIGTPKTGTTAIQNFLLLNEAQLERYGILHPHIEAEGIARVFIALRNARFLAYNAMEAEERKKQTEERIYKEGFKIIAQSAAKYGKIVISDEILWLRQNKSKDLWQKINKDAKLAGCEVKVIVYLRRQDLYIQAVWNQAVKHQTRLDQPFDYFLNHGARRKNLDYYKTLHRIAQDIGKENLIVRVYEKETMQRSGGIHQDFLNAIGEPMRSEYQIPEKIFNERLDGNFLEIKRILNQIPEYKQMPKDFFYQPVFDAYKLKQPEKTSYFPYDKQVEFLKKYEESNRRTAEEFLGRADGKLFAEPLEKLPQWKINHDTMYQDIILFYANLALNQQKQIDEYEKLALNQQKQIDGLDYAVRHPFAHMAALIKKFCTKAIVQACLRT